MGKGKRLRSVSAQATRAIAKRERKGLKGGLILTKPLEDIKPATLKGPIKKGSGVNVRDPNAVKRKPTKFEKWAEKNKNKEGADMAL